MKRVTTPQHTFAFPEAVNVENCEEIVITYAQAGNILTKNKSNLSLDLENNAVSCTLTQQETALFCPGLAAVQIRVKMTTGKVIASQIIKFPVRPVLNEEIL